MERDYLRIQICSFISRFGVVTEAQIHKMFRNANSTTVAYHLDWLDFAHIISRKDGNVSLYGCNTVSQFNQRLMTAAAWVVAEYGADNIEWYYTSEYPTQVVFATKEGEVFDVITLYPDYIKEAIQVAKRVSAMSTYTDDDTGIRHIGLAFNGRDAEIAEKAGFFDVCATLDREKNVCLKECG